MRLVKYTCGMLITVIVVYYRLGITNYFFHRANWNAYSATTKGDEVLIVYKKYDGLKPSTLLVST